LYEHSGIGKQRISDYLEYLEAAYLIRRVHRIDDNAERLQRARTFKVYLTNPSVRAALFGPVSAEDDAMGGLAETAVWGQRLHSFDLSGALHYARWKSGRADLEVDIVGLEQGTQKPSLAVEVKWSDRIVEHPEELDGLLTLAMKHPLRSNPVVTTRTVTELRRIRKVRVEFIPAAVYCYAIAKDSRR
jgi:predicted AAA+ superfamily ATPase